VTSSQKSRDRRCVSNSGAVLRHFHVRLCCVKIDSAVSLGETPSSKFMQCVV